jgi:hypothetical protein
MERERSVYSEIKALRKQLDEAGSSVKKSRHAGQQLVELLGMAGNRLKLAAEAQPAPSQRTSAQTAKALQRVALAEMWRLLIQSAVTSVHMIAQGKSRLTLLDIRLPHKLLVLCNQQDEFFDEENVIISKDQVKLLFAYCMDMLDDSQTLEICGAEMELLAMVCYMCKRREFVAYFRPEQHIAYIMEQVEKRILVADNQGVDDDFANDSKLRLTTAQPASQIFSSLLSTSHDMGIDICIILPQTIRFVAKWCSETNELSQQHSRDPVVDAVTCNLLSGSSMLLKSHPDLAVASLTRHGQPILKTVKLFFAMLDSPKVTKPNQVVLVEFMLRYL